MAIFLGVVLTFAEAMVFVGPLALVVYFLRARMGLSGRENPFGDPPAPSASWFTPRVIVVVWLVALGVMFFLYWRLP